MPPLSQVIVYLVPVLHSTCIAYTSLIKFLCIFSSLNHEKVQVGKDQEKAQSEKDSHSKNRGGKKPNQQSGTYTMKTFRKPNEQLFSQ